MRLGKQILIATVLALSAGLASATRPILFPPIPTEPRRPGLTRSTSSLNLGPVSNTTDQDRFLDVLAHARVLEAWEREPRQWLVGRLRDPSKEA